MDCFFRGKLRFDDRRWRFDSLRKVSSLAERSLFHVRRQLGAGATKGILSLGLAAFSIRSNALPLLAVVGDIAVAECRTSVIPALAIG